MKTPALKRIAPAIAAGLIAANAAAPAARGQEVPPPGEAPPSEPVNPRDPYPNPPPPEDLARMKAEQAQAQAPAKPKITGGLVAEAGGGLAGGLLAQGVGTAVAGPIGGFAASWVGSTVGGKAVHVVRKMFHRKKPAEAEQAQTAQPAPAVDAAATAPERVSDPTPN